MLRNVGAVVLGLLVGSCLNMGLILLNAVWFPMPADGSDAEAMRAWIAGLQPLAYALPLTAHMTQAFVGGWLAARLGASHPRLLAMIVALLTMAGGVANMLMQPFPAWLWAEMPGYPLCGWLAGTLEARRRADT